MAWFTARALRQQSRSPIDTDDPSDHHDRERDATGDAADEGKRVHHRADSSSGTSAG
jgi:hypothetical protein